MAKLRMYISTGIGTIHLVECVNVCVARIRELLVEVSQGVPAENGKSLQQGRLVRPLGFSVLPKDMMTG